VRPTVTVVALSVCLLDSTVRPAKTPEPIQMPFGVKISVNPSSHVLDVEIPQERGHFCGGAPCDAAFCRNSLTIYYSDVT